MRLLRLRWPAVCHDCGRHLPARVEAWWESAEKVARCRPCVEGAALAVELAGRGGDSARREYERRHAKRKAQLESRFGRLASVVETLTQEPQSTRAWAKGASGEQRLAALLDREFDGRALVLHDRAVPGSRANIDHVVVAPSGIWVVDAKSYAGKVERTVSGAFFKPNVRLLVRGRDQSKLADGAYAQLDVVQRALGACEVELPLRAALCFVDSEWGLFAKPFLFRDVLVCYPAGLVKRIREPGPLDLELVGRTAARLATALPPV